MTYFENNNNNNNEDAECSLASFINLKKLPEFLLCKFKDVYCPFCEKFCF